MTHRKLISMCLLLCMTMSSTQAQEQNNQKKSFKEQLLHYLDSSNVQGTDPEYIALPQRRA